MNIISKYIGLIAFLVFAMVFKVYTSSSGSKRKKEIEMYFNAEREANFARLKEIPEDMYFKTDVNLLPVKNYPPGDKYKKIKTAQERALKKSNSIMLRLDPPLKNIEIKRTFGIANLERITKYEENYEQYIRALCNWANELIACENFTDAKTILKICVDMNSQVFLPYSLLCDIYEKDTDKKSLIQLLEKVQSTEILYSNDILSKKINDCINKKLRSV